MTTTAVGRAGMVSARAQDDPIRVVIAEDSVLLREGIVRLLEQSGFEVAGQAGDGEDLLREVGAHKPDVAVIDVRMPRPTRTRACAPPTVSGPSTLHRRAGALPVRR